MGTEDSLALHTQDSLPGRGENRILTTPLPSVVHKRHRTGGGHGEWSLDYDRRGRSQGPRKVGRTPAGITGHRVLWEEIKSLV